MGVGVLGGGERPHLHRPGGGQGLGLTPRQDRRLEAVVLVTAKQDVLRDAIASKVLRVHSQKPVGHLHGLVAVDQIERLVHRVPEYPFDVPPWSVGLLAAKCELAQGGEVGVVEAKRNCLFGGYGFLESPAVRQRADRDSLAPGLALEHLAGAVEPEVVGDDEAGDDGFPESPARFDQAFVCTGDRVLGEHDPGHGGVQERLRDNADARLREEPDGLAVGVPLVRPAATGSPFTYATLSMAAGYRARRRRLVSADYAQRETVRHTISGK